MLERIGKVSDRVAMAPKGRHSLEGAHRLWKGVEEHILQIEFIKVDEPLEGLPFLFLRPVLDQFEGEDLFGSLQGLIDRVKGLLGMTF